MTERATHPTIAELCGQIDQINAKAMRLIEHLQAERDSFKAALLEIASHPRQPLGDARRWAYALHAIACNALASNVYREGQASEGSGAAVSPRDASLEVSSPSGTSATESLPLPWRFESRNVPIGDTGDYDGVIAILAANGVIVVDCWNPRDDQEAALRQIVEVMNSPVETNGDLSLARNALSNLYMAVLKFGPIDRDIQFAMNEAGQLIGSPVQLKAEANPPLTLRDFGYAPGNYTCRCFTCERDFVGDKRAIQCERCATERLARSQQKTSQQRPEVPQGE